MRPIGFAAVLKAMLDVIMNHFALSVGNRAFDSMKLLREVDARPAVFEHR